MSWHQTTTGWTSSFAWRKGRLLLVLSLPVLFAAAANRSRRQQLHLPLAAQVSGRVGAHWVFWIGPGQQLRRSLEQSQQLLVGDCEHVQWLVREWKVIVTDQQDVSVIHFEFYFHTFHGRGIRANNIAGRHRLLVANSRVRFVREPPQVATRCTTVTQHSDFPHVEHRR